MYVDTRYHYVPRSRAGLIWSLALLILATCIGGAWWLARIPGPVATAQLAGRVVTEQDLPVPGAQVELLGRTVDGKPVAYVTHTHDDGAFSLAQVATPVAYVARLTQDDTGVFDQVAVEVATGGPQEDRAFRVATRHTVRGLVTDQLGQPLAGAPVMAYVPSPEGDGRQVHGLTDAKGRYLLRFAEKPSSGVRVAATAPGHLPGEQAGPIPRVRLGVQAFDMEPIVLRLTGSAAGRVMDAQGRPVAGAEVQVRARVDAGLFAEWTEERLRGSTSLGVHVAPPTTDDQAALARFRARTAPDGRFRITVPLPCDAVDVVVLSRGRPPLVTHLETRLHPRGSELTELAELRLPPAETLRVHLEHRGDALAAVRVRFRDLRLPDADALLTPWLDTDERGSVSTWALLPGGRYDVLVDDDGRERVLFDVPIEDGAVLDID